MKDDYLNSFEQRDLNLNREDIDISDNQRYLTAYIETWFDVDKKFGLNTKQYDNVWVNLFCHYNPFESTIDIFYCIDTGDICVERAYQATKEEKKIFKNLMEEMCIKNEQMSCKDFLLQSYLENVKNLKMVCEQYTGGYQIRNTLDDFVLWTEDDSGELKKHVGHEIEVVNYKNGGYYFLVCKDCYLELHSVERQDVDVLLKEQGIATKIPKTEIELG